MIRPLLTFTGVDANTNVRWLNDVAMNNCHPNGYSAIELAILRSPKAGQSNRYPTKDVVERIHNKIRPAYLAYHLCGGYARMVHEMRWGELFDIIDFSKVGRVQVNSTEAGEKAIVTLQRFSVAIGKPVIMQWRGEAFPLAVGLDLLQDRSGGQGQLPSDWISPDDLCKSAGTRANIGYAGGLSPETLREQLPHIVKAAKGKSFWLDCESGIRTDDWFDTAKVQQMIDIVARPDGRVVVAS